MKFLQKIKNAISRYEDTHNFTCDICGREVFENERVCATCRRELPYNSGKICPLCGRAVGEEGVCLECKQKPLGVEKARSVFLHEGEAARLVVRFKRGSKYLCRTLAELAHPLLMREFTECDLITCVPMTKKAEKKRGYNQSRLLAEELAKRSGKPFCMLSEKRRETDSQKFLGRAERERNLEGCFHITDRKALKGQRVLIVDDTLTTGSTVSELAGALKRAGAESVFALTVTSVPHKHPFGEPPKK